MFFATLPFVRVTSKSKTETVAPGNTPLIIKLYQSVKYL